MSLKNIYESGRTIRYHSNPTMNHLGQSVADHTWGMIAMLFYLHPNPGQNLIGYITFHDSEERWVGDIPYPVKKAMPDLIAQHEAIGAIFCRKMGIPHFVISEEDRKWVKLLDRLEAYQFAKLHRKIDQDWAQNNKDCLDAARELGVDHLVATIFN